MPFLNRGTGILPVVEHGQDGRATKENAGFETASKRGSLEVPTGFEPVYTDLQSAA
jgi:hypothetical protein